MCAGELAAARVLEDDHGVLGLLVRIPLVEAPHHLRKRGLVACRLLGGPGRRRLLCGCRRSLHREGDATAGPCVAGPVLHHNVVGLLMDQHEVVYDGMRPCVDAARSS